MDLIRSGLLHLGTCRPGSPPADFGSLALATMDPDGWRFGVGGSGFNAADLKEISAQLQGLRVASPVIPRQGPPRGLSG